jgi:hypothetical protein
MPHSVQIGAGYAIGIDALAKAAGGFSALCMANVYIEPRPKGRPEGKPLEDYAVEDSANGVLATRRTQAEAIAWAKGARPRAAGRAREEHRQGESRPLAICSMPPSNSGVIAYSF